MYALALIALAAPVWATVPDGVIALPLQRILNQTAYGVELQVGTPPQNVILLVDTGSPTNGVESRLNDICAQGRCDRYGLYDNTTSRASKWLSATYFDMVYDGGGGSLVNDTMILGGQKVASMKFGVIEQYNSRVPIVGEKAGFFGLGAVCHTPKCDDYDTVVQQLYQRGILAKRAFSMYLGNNAADAKGMILLGGIDKAKRQGLVTKTKIYIGDSGQINFTGLESIEVHDTKGKATTVQKYSKDDRALWDTGSPRWYLPDNVFEDAVQRWGLPKGTNTGQDGYVTVDCKYLEPTKEAVVAKFQGGQTISVPLHHMVVQLDKDKCVSFISSGGVTFGDTFLREVYTTFDYDAMTLEFAAVKHTDESDISRIQ